VIAIAAIIALGAGLHAGLGSTSVWRSASLDATWATLRFHDVEVATLGGLSAPSEQLVEAVKAAGGADIEDVEPRLEVNLPVRAAGGRIPAAGVLVGTDVQHARIDRTWIAAGRAPRPGEEAVLLDQHFAVAHSLPSEGTLEVAGSNVRYVGTALHPDNLTTNVAFGATIQGAATRAVIYAPIEVVQRLAGRPGEADHAVVRLAPGADGDALAARLTARLPTTLPGLPTSATARSGDPSVRALEDGITSEQRMFDVFSLLILAGAGFAAFNLTRRVVESQRRDIGVAMALGVPPRRIAIRPMVMAAEIAAVGVLLGALAGWGIGAWVLGVIRTQLLLPVWRTPWQPGLFARAAALGLAIPLAGTAYPVWRAVRVPPTDALLPPHLRGRHRAGSWLRRLRLPGSTLAQAPLRRLVVAPARSTMTVLGVGLIVAPLFAAFGTTDSTTYTVDVGGRGASTGEDQLLVSMARYQPRDAKAVRAVTGSPLVARASVALDTGGYLVGRGDPLGLSISMVDLHDPLVVPEELARRKIRPGGIVLAAKAADDIGVSEGGTVQLRHPVLTTGGYRFTTTTLPVRAVVDIPYRFVAYMSLEDEDLMGLSGIVNAAVVVPRPGVGLDELQRSVAGTPGVAWALSARSVSNTIRDVLSVVGGMFAVLQVVIGLLALLVAYNSVKVGTDERSRENATMMAYGVTVPTIVSVAVAESALLAVLAAGVGLAVGQGLLAWILESVMPAAVPELAVLRHVRAGSYVMTAVIGIAAMLVAPLMITRQLRRTNLPNALRYVE